MRSLQQFSQFDLTTIAVRGENLALARSSRPMTRVTSRRVLVVGQIDDDGHVVAPSPSTTMISRTPIRIGASLLAVKARRLQKRAP